MAAPTSSHHHPAGPPGGVSDPRGVVLCLLSCLGFGAMAIIAKDAYAAGAGALTLLAVRFSLAAVALWALVASQRRSRAVLNRLTPARPRARRRQRLAALALGAGVYAVEAGLFYAALLRMDASVTELLLYGYPGIVLIAAALLGRERVSAQRAGALAVATGGVVLVMLGGGAGALDPLGVVLALGSALAYAGYVLAADHLGGALDPFELAALVATGAAVALMAAGAASGSLHFAALGPRAWADAAGLAALCTVLPMVTLYAGMRRVGPATASIVSCAEPVLTVALAVVLLGERLGPVQAAGGALVVLAVLLIQRRGTVQGDAAPARPAAAPPARALASSAA
jgi:drug/metabolite transporter (DMT)-like permease